MIFHDDDDESSSVTVWKNCWIVRKADGTITSVKEENFHDAYENADAPDTECGICADMLRNDARWRHLRRTILIMENNGICEFRLPFSPSESELCKGDELDKAIDDDMPMTKEQP